MNKFSLPAVMMLCLGATASVGQSVVATLPTACITAPEAETLVASVMPELVLEAGQICTKTLPPTALLRQISGPFLMRYKAEAQIAWPQAKALIGEVGGPLAQTVADSAIARTLLATLVAAVIAKQLKPADCPAINRVLTLAEPLPPRNTAGLIVAILQLTGVKQQEKRTLLPICKAEDRANG
ncbi:MAG: hypothetical protein WC803_03070 [Sphingomonas sp.]|jgi:hypothetical protein